MWSFDKCPFEYFDIFGSYLSKRFLFPLTPALKKLQPAAGRCRHQITEVDQTRIPFNIILVMKNNKHHFYSDIVKTLSF
jgi:hypothetical protein